jgi:thiazole synthase ThiGH ThiG subunit
MNDPQHTGLTIAGKTYSSRLLVGSGKYKDLEQENTRLKKLVADLSLREVMLKEVIKGNF